MNSFEKLVAKMRAAQIAYNETGKNLDVVEDLEDEVDEYLDFVMNCKGSDYKSVKRFLERGVI